MFWSTNNPMSIYYVLWVKLRNTFNSPPKSHPRDRLKCFGFLYSYQNLQSPNVSEGYWQVEYNMQCPLTNYLKKGSGNTLAHFQVFRLLQIRKKDLLYTELLQNSCIGMFINIKNFEDYSSPAISSQHLCSFWNDIETLQV